MLLSKQIERKHLRTALRITHHYACSTVAPGQAAGVGSCAEPDCSHPAWLIFSKALHRQYARRLALQGNLLRLGAWRLVFGKLVLWALSARPSAEIRSEHASKDDWDTRESLACSELSHTGCIEAHHATHPGTTGE